MKLFSFGGTKKEAAPAKQKLRVYCPLLDETNFCRLRRDIDRLFERVEREKRSAGIRPFIAAVYSYIALNHAYDIGSDEAEKNAGKIFLGLPDCWCAIAYTVREMRDGLPVSTLYLISPDGVQHYTGKRMGEREKKRITGRFGESILHEIYGRQKGAAAEYPRVRVPGGLALEARIGEDLADSPAETEADTITLASSNGMAGTDNSSLGIIGKRKALVVNDGMTEKLVWTMKGSGDRFEVSTSIRGFPFFSRPDKFPYAALLG